MIENIRKDEIKDFCNSNSLCARITDIKFDLQDIKSDIDQILELNPPISKDRQSKYKALGLQYADDSTNCYECVETTRYFDADKKIAVIEKRSFKEFGHWNSLGEQLSYLFKPLDKLGIKLYRTRILLANGDYTSVNHIDYDWRYHVPIQTNKQCYLTYTDLDENIHLPADGHAYILNAGFAHKFYNGGITDRYHYCGILDLPCIGDGDFLGYLDRAGMKTLDRSE